MNAQMYAVPGSNYMPASLECPTTSAPGIAVIRPKARRANVHVNTLSGSSVQDLLEAAGPLSVGDIAAGLGVSVREAKAVVWRMVDEDCLKQDEWDRLLLKGSCK